MLYVFDRGHGSAPDGSSPRGCEQACAVAYSLDFVAVSPSFNTANVWFLMLITGGGPMTLLKMLLLLWTVRLFLSAAFT